MDRDEGDAASPANSAVAIRGAEDVSLWREHHVVERLREHRRRADIMAFLRLRSIRCLSKGLRLAR